MTEAKDTSSGRSTKDIVITTLLTALLMISIMGWNGIKEDVKRLDSSKADSKVIEVHLVNLSKEIRELKEMLKQ